MSITFGITEVCAHSAPNFSTSFFKFNVAASLIAYTNTNIFQCYFNIYNNIFFRNYSKSIKYIIQISRNTGKNIKCVLKDNFIRYSLYYVF